MAKLQFLFLGILMIAGGVYLLDTGIRKQITLDVDGQIIPLTTTALTVGEAIEAHGLELSEADNVFPEMSLWINDGDTISIQKATWFQIRAEGNIKAFHTIEKIPANVLNLAGYPLYPGDQILIDGREASPDVPLPPGGSHSILIRRAYPIEINTGSEIKTFYSSAPTIGQALWESNLRLKVNDRLDNSVETPLSGPVELKIDESHRLTISVAKRTIHSRSAAATVGGALQDAGISLQGLDYSVPSVDALLPANGKIRVVQVRESFVLEAEPLQFETETQPDPDVEIDNESVIQPGVYGLQARRIRLHHADGIEVSRQVEVEYVAQEPQTQINGYGTKIVSHTLDIPGGEITYWRALNMYAVSYKPSSAGDNITATGAILQKGIAAIDPNYIPYGTQMYIPGYGLAVAADTGGGVQGRLIDLGYTDEDYVSWHQWVTVYFLWPPPEFVAWFIP
jgi:resuscitation-promoting factor RpfB